MLLLGAALWLAADATLVLFNGELATGLEVEDVILDGTATKKEQLNKELKINPVYFKMKGRFE